MGMLIQESAGGNVQKVCLSRIAKDQRSNFALDGGHTWLLLDIVNDLNTGHRSNDLCVIHADLPLCYEFLSISHY